MYMSLDKARGKLLTSLGYNDPFKLAFGETFAG